MKIKHYMTTSGRVPVLDFVLGLSEHMQGKFQDLIVKLEEGEILTLPDSRPLKNVHSHLHELRIKDDSGVYRIFYYIKVRDAIYMLHAFKKKTQKTPMKELKIAINRIKEIN